jgi:hypothetical protein
MVKSTPRQWPAAEALPLMLFLPLLLLLLLLWLSSSLFMLLLSAMLIAGTCQRGQTWQVDGGQTGLHCCCTIYFHELAWQVCFSRVHTMWLLDTFECQPHAFRPD